MGGLCSKRSAVDKSPSETTLDPNGLKDQEGPNQSFDKMDCDSVNSTGGEAMGKRLQEQEAGNIAESEPKFFRTLSYNFGSTKPKPSRTAKVSEVSSVLGKAGSVGLGKAVEVLDTLGSSMTSLHFSGSFVSGASIKGNKISILSFEIANTIVKGYNVMQSLSKDNIKHLKEVVLLSEGVQYLISKDMGDLLRIAATDKSEELKLFSNEVVRFGNCCKDPQWHNLERYFDRLTSERSHQNQLKEVAERAMEQLMTLAHYTAELYHEFHALDKFEQDYRRKHQEEDITNGMNKGDNLQILKQELKSQSKHVKLLKKKSLWSKNLDEVLEKLVDIVHFLYVQIHDSFGTDENYKFQNDDEKTAEVIGSQRLGPAGLALHYANIITQIDTLVSRSSSVPPNMRDSLYQGLPLTIKNAFRSRLLSLQIKEELTIPQIKEEMEKTLRWLVPMANNTTKAHHGFGWVGEWANIGSEINHKAGGQSDLLRIKTLHHADKEKTEGYILDLVVWLQHLVCHSKSGIGGTRSPIKSPVCSPTQRGLTVVSPSLKLSIPSSTLSREDQEMLHYVNLRKITPGISKSQEFDTAKKKAGKNNRLSKSNSHSPTSSDKKDFFMPRRPSMLPVIGFATDWTKALDVIDQVDNIRKP
ncbi:protein PSK SIMULATOR 1-like [Zingiber officinale]|uniref:protein PSK SIMULATOR 1-like n=1 Tax=Zingiber officinale TaxID=94328 RepID=UPI001C4DAB1B|nr:protein PSK SIMULATOR 1-like [Zingiber officinale]